MLGKRPRAMMLKPEDMDRIAVFPWALFSWRDQKLEESKLGSCITWKYIDKKKSYLCFVKILTDLSLHVDVKREREI